MAVGYNTSIVTNGLRLYLDAGNPKSYTLGENLYTYSQDFAQASWGKSTNFTFTANSAVAPDGTNTATKIVMNNAYGGLDIPIFTTINTTTGTTYTQSVYLKSSGWTYAYFWLDRGDGFGCTFEINLLTGQTRNTRIGDNVAFTNFSTSLSSVGNGWYRASITATATALAGNAQFRIYPSNVQWVSGNFGTPIPTGDGTNGIFIWGAQIERSPTANKYTLTTASASTASTTWTDLSGNGFNATLFNSPTFTSANNGCFIFNGTSNYIEFPNPLNQSQISQEWTVQSWINITTKPAQVLVSGLNDGLWIEYAQGNNSLLYLNSGANDYYTYGGQFTAQGWVLATFRFNNSNSNREIIRNRANITTSGPNFTNTPSGQSPTFTMSNTASGPILGRVSTMFMYNRYLTDTEVEQNFGALRGRYSV